MRVDISPDAEAWALGELSAWMQAVLGPQIVMRAKAFCPVDTGTLRDGIHQELDDLDLIVAADEGGQPPRSIAAYLELGHRVFHVETREVGPEWVVARPFIRPAVYWGWWAGPIGAVVPEESARWRPWQPEFGFGGDVRGPFGSQAKPRTATGG